MLDTGKGQTGERIEGEELSTTTGTNVRFPMPLDYTRSIDFRRRHRRYARFLACSNERMISRFG